MKGLKYLDIIVNGILNHESILKIYLIRKQKEAESNYFVSELEFIKRCNDMVLLLEYDIENQYMQRRTELYQTVELLKSKNKPFEKELELAKRLSKDNFHLQLAPFTKNKFKGEIWYNQIISLKKNLFEISIQNIKFDVELRDLDIDNYLNFVFNYKSISRESKKNAVLKLIEYSKIKKSIINYRICIDYVFNQLSFWKEPTEKEIKSFEELRIKSSEKMFNLFRNHSKRSPKPKEILEKEYENAVVNRLSKEPYLETTSDLIKGNSPKDLKILAIVIGKIDFIKTLNNIKSDKKTDKPIINELTLKEIALKCYYEGKILNRENAKNELEGTKYNSSDKLYSYFTKWSNNTDRRAYPDNNLKLHNKIKNFENVIKLLPLNNRDNAINDLNILKEYLTKY